MGVPSSGCPSRSLRGLPEGPSAYPGIDRVRNVPRSLIPGPVGTRVESQLLRPPSCCDRCEQRGSNGSAPPGALPSFSLRLVRTGPSATFNVPVTASDCWFGLHQLNPAGPECGCTGAQVHVLPGAGATVRSRLPLVADSQDKHFSLGFPGKLRLERDLEAGRYI